MKYFDNLTKLPKMWTIWAKYLPLQALKSCPNWNKSPNFVTLGVAEISIKLRSEQHL